VVKKVEAILDSPAKWDKASTQDCNREAKTFGIYCAFEAASIAVTGKADDRAPGMREARQLISRTAPNAAHYRARSGSSSTWKSASGRCPIHRSHPLLLARWSAGDSSQCCPSEITKTVADRNDSCIGELGTTWEQQVPNTRYTLMLGAVKG
jgi:hypothetical protein